MRNGYSPTVKRAIPTSPLPLLVCRQRRVNPGGSRPAMESFKAFRGREPSMDALLRHQGMA